MSISKKVLKLRQTILKANTQLDQLKNSGSLDESNEANIKYNRILIQKAIAKKELDEARCSIIQKFFKKFSHSSGKREKLICDYFKS